MGPSKTPPVRSEKFPKKKSSTKGARSGLQFSVSRVDKKLRGAKICKQVSGTTSIFVAGIVEYVVMEILRLAGEQAKGKKSKRILPQNAIDAVRTDPDLARLFAGFAFTGAEDVPKAIDKILPPDEQYTRSLRKRKMPTQEDITNNLVDD